MPRTEHDEAKLSDPGLPLLELPHAACAEGTAEALTALMTRVAAMPLKLSVTWKSTAGGIVSNGPGDPAITRAGTRIAQWTDQHAIQADRHAYHNRQHVCEVMLVAAFLGRLHRLAASELQLLLLAVLIHDLDHPGQPERHFASERRSILRARPFLQGAMIQPVAQAQLAALVLATEPTEGVRYARACLEEPAGAGLLPPPTAAPELQLLRADNNLARLAGLLCEADILPSVGLTPAYALALHARLAAEWGRALALSDKLNFVERTLAMGTVGDFFKPNVHRLRQALLADLNKHAVA